MAKKKPQAAYLAAPEEDPNFEALDAFLGGLTASQPAQELPSRGAVRGMADVVLAGGRGAVQGVRMLTDLAGSDNAASRGLRTVEDFIGGLRSAQAQQDDQKAAEILQAAEGAGVLDQVIAGAKAFAVAPVSTLAQAVGTSIPTIGAALIPGVGQGAAAARMAAALGVGAAQGAGSVKGQIYDEVKQELLKAGASPEEAEQRALQASSYAQSGGKIATGAALGAAAGSTGMERAIGALSRGVAKEAPGMARRVLAGGATEAVPEFAQGAQEKLSSNQALYEQGFDVAPGSGVIAAGTMEGLAGFGMGAAAGLPRPAVRAGDQLRAEGLQPERGPYTRASNAAVEAAANKVDFDPSLLAAGQKLQGMAGLEQAGTAPGAAAPKQTFGNEIAYTPDPDTGRLAIGDATEIAKANIARTAAKHEPMPQDVADGIVAKATERGLNMVAVPHPEGGGFTVVPREWVTAAMAAPQAAPAGPSVAERAMQAAESLTLEGDPAVAAAEQEARRAQIQSAPVDRAPRQRTPEPAAPTPAVPADLVQAYVESRRNDGTPAGRFFATEFDAGRITRDEVQGLIDAARPKSPDQRLAEAAAQAPKPQAPQPGDILNPKGEPYVSQRAAEKKAKQIGGSVIVVDGGWSVRPKEADARTSNAPQSGGSVGKPVADDGRSARTGELRDGRPADVPDGAGKPADQVRAGNDAAAVQPGRTGAASELTTDLPTLKRQWQAAVQAGDGATASAINDRIVALKANAAVQPATEAPASQAAAPGAVAAAPAANVPGAGGGAVEADGVTQSATAATDQAPVKQPAVKGSKKAAEIKAKRAAKVEKEPVGANGVNWQRMPVREGMSAGSLRHRFTTNEGMDGQVLVSPPGWRKGVNSYVVSFDRTGGPKGEDGKTKFYPTVDIGKYRTEEAARIAAEKVIADNRVAAKTPAPAAPESAASTTQGEGHGQTQEEAQGLLKKEAPADVTTAGATATHADPGEAAEPATPAVVKEAAQNEYPLGKTDREDRFFGTRVRVLPDLRGDTPWEGVIHSTLNGGRLFSVKRADNDNGTFRISGNRIKVLEVKDAEKADSKPAQDQGATVAPEGPGTTQAAPSPAASKNTVFTEDAAAAARARLKAKLGRLNSGIDPEMMMDGITLAGYHIEKGARTFAAYARAMVDDLGVAVKPYLQSWYMAVRADPRAGAFKADMDKASAVEDVDVDAVLADSGTTTAADQAQNAVKETSNATPELDRPGPAALAGAPAEEVRPAEGGRDADVGADGSGGRDFARPAEPDGAGVQLPGSVGAGARELPVPAGGKGRKPRGAGKRGIQDRASDQPGLGFTENAGGTGGLIPANPAPNAEPVASPAFTPEDFTIEDDLGLGEGGAKTKYRGNVDAIRLLRELEATGRMATPSEQRVLAKYVGWGGLSQAFDADKSDWSKEHAELKALLSSEEWDAAARSTRYAHYTSREIIVDGIYAALLRMGFRGGRTLEGGAGVGNFIGLMPADMRSASRFTAIEREPFSAAIARHLYPKQNVQEADFTAFVGNDDFYDAAVGNPPFAQDPQVDTSGRKHLSGLSLHNYFFAKEVDMLREGGILAQVITNGFLDAKTDTARRYIADRTKLLGAIRLPNNAFSKNAGTEVTTDLIFLQKRPESEWGGKAARLDAKRWMDIGQHRDAEGRVVPLNQYFIDNPQMMLGKFGAYGTMYHGESPALVQNPGQDTGALLRQAVESLPADVYVDRAASITAAMEQEVVKALRDPTVQEGGYFLQDGKLHQRIKDIAGEARSREITAGTKWTEKTTLGENGVARLTALAELRTTLRALLAAELSSDPAMDALRAKLNEQYDAYTKDHGLINDKGTLRVFDDDPDFPLLSSLEHGYTPGIGVVAARTMGIKAFPAKASKAPIFTRRVIDARKQVQEVKTPADALAVSMAERGKLDSAYIGKLLGRNPDEVLAELADGDKPLLFRDPATDEYVLRDAYLSGNVRAKLIQAKQAGMFGNIRALEEVQPEDVGAHEIVARVGSPWVPERVYEDFAKALFGPGTKASIRYVKMSAGYTVSITPENSVANTSTWGTSSYPGDDLLAAMLNNRPIRVTYKDADGNLRTDKEATEAANIKAQDVRNKFQDWLFTDADRSEILVRAYNDTNNNYVTREFDGSWMTFPGKVPDAIVKFRRHQRNAIARIVQDRTALLDHVVGAGKTYTVIAAAMELKRTGLSKKPLIVVPNHLVKQWAADFYRLYPGANILTATKKDFEKDNRRKFLAKIATGDWDAVIMAHSSFGFVKPAPEFETQFNTRQIKAIVDTIKQVEDGDSDQQQKKRTVKQLEGLKERLENRIKSLRDKPMDALLDFEEIGVDQLFVDEAHLFKNLMFSTKMQNVSGLGDSKGSQRAYDMYVKTNEVMAKNGRGQGVVFATGTPVSNSLAEMYHMMRYLMPLAMEENGFQSFDAWANTFAAVEQVWMQKASGDGFKPQNRMGTFVNTPDLLKMFDQVSDTVTMEDIKKAFREENDGKEFPLPKLKGGKRTPVSMRKSKAQDAYMATIAERAQRLEARRGPPQKGDDNILVLMTDARKAAMDIRLVDPTITEREPGGRIDRASQEIAARYKRFDQVKGTQLVFSDLGTPLKAVKKELIEFQELQARIEAGTGEDVQIAANLGNEAALAKIEDAEAAQEELDGKGRDWVGAMQAAQRGFSVYDDLKAALVEKGIPEAEIAFIHDYNTDEQKAGLFRKVNAGQIRVLMGSTPKLGAGTNVQERLVALHHLDVPWKPSDVEQREGRIIRQGNTLDAKIPGFEVEVMAYVTQDSLDMRMWQVQETKLKMINQLRTRKVGREIDNAFEDLELSAGEMQAAATGNIDLLREIQLRSDIKKLEQRKRAFDAQKTDLQNRRKNVEQTIAALPAKIEQSRVMAEGEALYRKALDAREFSATIDGKTYTDAKAAGEVLQAMVDAKTVKFPDGKGGWLPKTYTQAEVEAGLPEKDGIDAEAMKLKKEQATPLSVELNGETYTSRAKLADAFAAARGDVRPISWTFNGTEYARRVALADALRQDAADSLMEQAPREIGSIGPFAVTIEGGKSAWGEYVEVLLQYGGKEVSTTVAGQADAGKLALSIITAAENMASGAQQQYSYQQHQLKQAQKQKAELDATPNPGEWPDADKLTKAREAHQKILRNLASAGVQVAAPEPGSTIETLQGDMQATGQVENETDVVFSRGGAGAQRVNLESARQLADQLAFTGLLRLNVVQSTTDMPMRLQRQLSKSAPDGRVRGAYFRSTDEVWMVADHIRGANEFVEVALHEAFHRGLGKLIPEAQPLLREIWRTNQNVRRITADQMRQHGIGRDEAIEEALAKMAEAGEVRDLKGWPKLLEAIRTWLGKMARAVGIEMVWTDDMVADLVAASTREGLKAGVHANTKEGIAADRQSAFERWFGDSKVVDASGKPLVVYHGTAADFAVFDKKRVGATFGADTQGFFFSSDTKTASGYADFAASGGRPEANGISGANVIPAYVSLKNPLTLEGYVAQYGGGIRPRHGKGPDALTRLFDDDRYLILQAAKRGGHDGILFSRDGHQLVVAFRPEQIKSAIGNRGDFDPTNPDIRAKRAPAVTVETDEATGAPIYATDDISIGFPQETERFEYVLGDGEKIVNYSIGPADGFDSYGFVELVIGADGIPKALADIEVKPELRGQAIGEKVMAAILGAHPGTDIEISNIVEGARGFWAKMGVPEQNRAAGEAYDGTLNYQTFQEAQDERAANRAAAGRGAAGEGRNASAEDRAQGADGQAQGLMLSRAEPADAADMRAAPRKVSAQDLVNSAGGVFDFNRLGETKQDRIRSVVDGSRPFWMGALTRDQLADVYGAEIPQVREYDQITRTMENERSKRAQDADSIYQEWSKLRPAVNLSVSRIMADATLYSVDPDGEFKPQTGNVAGDEEDRKRVHERISKEFDALPPDAKAIYEKVKAFHLQTLTDLQKALTDRIERQVAAGSARQAALTDIRKQFDKYLQNGPYFPLSRFGDYLVVANRESDGERVVASYETAGEQQAAARKLQADGFSVKLKTAKTYSRADDGAAGKFIGDVLSKINDLDIEGASLGGSMVDLKSTLLDDVNQLFIRALPDLSYRKHFAHRKGTPGFSSDMMRGFASSAFHSASHIARLNHADKMTFVLRDAYAAIENIGEGDFNKHSQVLNELTKRHDAALNPNTHPIASFLNSLGFTMYLGLSPAAGLVNLLQVPMVAMPYFGARYGFRTASVAFGKAYKDIMSAPMNRTNGFNAAESLQLTPAERAAIKTLQDEGVIDLTQAHDLASATGLDTGNVARSKASFAMARAMKIVGWTFHVPEVMNRQVTALMAYRLEMKASGNADAAVEAARTAIKRTQFDYSASNRARYMQGNLARVVTQFKQYSQNMTYLLARSMHQALRGETPEVRSIARRQLIATLGVTFAMAGSLGLPGIGMLGGLLGIAAGAVGDDDDPWDWKVEFRNLMADTFGKEIGEVVSHGVPRALMPWDLSSRVGLGDMWFRDGARAGDNPREAFAAHMANVLGPTAGTILGWYTAADHMARGNYAKAAESITPKFIRDSIKGVREGSEGVTSYSGEPLMDVTAPEAIGRVLGFAPARASEMYEARGAVMNAKTAVDEKRTALLGKLAKARMDGDAEKAADLQQEAIAWNRRNPEARITPQQIRQSIMARRRQQQNTEDGIALPKNRENLRELGRFANTG